MNASNTAPGLEFRPRRSHTKSRNGCIQCRQQRKKCDEAKPQCTRCVNRMLKCTYRSEQSQSAEPASAENASSSGNLHGSSQSSSGDESDLFLPPEDAFQLQENWPSSPGPSPDMDLTPEETFLFEHYLLHTRYTIPSGSHDSYSHCVGIPRLATRSRPLMYSVIALAAVCKCRDNIEQTPGVSPEQLLQAQQLLDMADGYHQKSMELIRDDIATTTHYNAVLAHATIMAVYAFAVHSVRIRLIKAANGLFSVPARFMPMPCQWMGHLRGIYIAYKALRDSEDESNDATEHQIHEQAMAVPRNVLENRTNTGQRLLPIVIATGSLAVNNIHSRLLRLDKTVQNMSLHSEADYRACVAALDVLHTMMNGICLIGKGSSHTAFAGHPDNIPPHSRLRRVEPWLRDLLMPASYSINRENLRRTVTAFVTKAPPEFWALIGRALGQGDEQAESQEWSPELLALALDICAHWLVLMVLSDNVWWLEGVAIWELQRLFSCVDGWDVFTHYRGANEEWWPETMMGMLEGQA